MLKNVPSEKISGTKHTFLFLPRAPTHHSFTFNLRFLYELKHKALVSKLSMGFSFLIPFRF